MHACVSFTCKLPVFLPAYVPGNTCNTFSMHERRSVGQNQAVLRRLIIQFPYVLGREWVSEQADEYAQPSARAKQAVHSKRVSEPCEQRSEQTSEWPSTHVSIYGCSCSEPQCRPEPDREGIKKKSETSFKWHNFMFPTDRRTDGLTNRQTQHPLLEMRDVRTSV